MQLVSTAFRDGNIIPERYTCKGSNISPPLSWQGAPTGTKSYALIVEDPDAPNGTFTHWVAWNIPADKSSLPTGFSPNGDGDGLLQGRNSFSQISYGGPCPPKGDGPHRYFFKLFALNAMLDLKPGMKKDDLEKAMQGHVLGQAGLMGKYEVQ